MSVDVDMDSGSGSGSELDFSVGLSSVHGDDAVCPSSVGFPVVPLDQ